MRIAQVAPLHQAVPPQYYGGVGRIISYITEELVSMGHDVTLFASADSKTSAKLISTCEKGLRPEYDGIEFCLDFIAPHFNQMEQIKLRASHFDLIHFHTDILSFPYFRDLKTPALLTLHGRMDLPSFQNLYREYSEIPLISLSNSQRAPLLFANWLKTIYLGIPSNLYAPKYEQGNYLLFLGRLSPEKKVEWAIEIALQSEIPIIIAGNVDSVDNQYFDNKIKPLLNHPLVEYIGPVDDRRKLELLHNAYCLLFPIDWPEPGATVVMEAMACATPIIAFNKGVVPEIVTDGLTGYVVTSTMEAVVAVPKIKNLSRKKIREHFENHYTSRIMVESYIQAYNELITRS